MWKKDWPEENSNTVDTKKYDKFHDSTTQWWYFNAHVHAVKVTEKDSKFENNLDLIKKSEDDIYKFGLFASFFNYLISSNGEEKKTDYAVAWGMTNYKEKFYFHDSLLNKSFPQALKNTLQ